MENIYVNLVKIINKKIVNEHNLSFIHKEGFVLLNKAGYYFFEKRKKNEKKHYPDLYIKEDLYEEFHRLELDDTNVQKTRDLFLNFPKQQRNSKEFNELNNVFNKIMVKNTYFIDLFNLLLKEQKKDEQRKIKAEKKQNEPAFEKDHKSAQKIEHYPDLFPIARKLKRKIYFFIGPTNSGKTYNALNKLLEFKEGVYLAPLRLLALEGQEEIEKRGEPCSFITGEEKDIKDEAKFIAQTIETFNFNKEIEAVLIDEIQMISDVYRGWAWTQAFVGAPARNIILTGSLDSLDLIKTLAKLLGDELEIINLNRFTLLEVLDEPVLSNKQGIDQLDDHTAIIVFSRKNVFYFKKLFDQENIKTSIIYGKLSPEVRREEARKFREGETKILISTDAIGMGLNLPIKHVIFGEVEKFNGKEVVELTPSEVKQIAGRAGRYLKFDVGHVSAINEEDIFFIRKNLNIQTTLQKIVYVKPTFDQIIKISKDINSTSLTKIYKKFDSLIEKEKNIYKSTDIDQLMDVLFLLDRTSISLENKIKFSMLPIDTSIKEYISIFANWLQVFEANGFISAKKFFYVPSNTFIKHDDYLQNAEKNINILTVYMWLSQQFPHFAPEYETAKKIKNDMNNYIIKFLE